MGTLLNKKTLFSSAVFFFLLAGLSLSGALLYPQTAGAGKNAWIIPIRGDIDPAMVTFIRREAGKALAGKADFIIFEIDTFGGRVDSALQITSFITSIKNARTVAWVNTGDGSMGVSWSAGALIAFACADIYMASGTSIGAAAPVTVGADGGTDSAGEKTVAALRSQMAALAERNGYPVGIALAMVDYDVELWEVLVDGRARVLTLGELERLESEQQAEDRPEEQGAARIERRSVISPPGKLLSLTSGEASRYGLAGLADDREALFAAIGVSETAGESSPGIADGIIAFLTSGPVQAVLIVLGLVMVFLELNTPGFGVPGVVAALAFIAVFGSGALLGRVDSLEIVLFLLGIGCLAVEIFVLPGFGIMGISGIILIGLSLLFSMQDFIIPQADWEWELLGRNAVVVVLSLFAAVGGIAVIALLGPKIRLFDGITLKTRITETAYSPLPAGSPDAAGDEDYAALTGKRGTAASTLRPSGTAEIGGRIYRVEGDGAFIEPGDPVEVVRVYGSRIVVRSCAGG
ncbi:MAG: nodulation protein NfeD [Treponema sp.]|jgi:membrane-bound serine protease (ClpP class)|nr:nodulation protein NfeD [Treponema sp.]